MKKLLCVVFTVCFTASGSLAQVILTPGAGAGAGGSAAAGAGAGAGAGAAGAAGGLFVGTGLGAVTTSIIVTAVTVGLASTVGGDEGTSTNGTN